MITSYYPAEWAMLAWDYYDFGEAKPTGLLIVQPKLNGIRAKWHHIEKVFISRAGNVIPRRLIPHLYEHFSTLKLETSLDGELYNHKIPFQTLCAMLAQNRIEPSTDHKQIQYHVFDLIDTHRRAEQRLDILYHLPKIPNKVSFEYTWINSTKTQELLDIAIKCNYEGLMIREPAAPYIHGRTRALIKVKKLQHEKVNIVDFIEGTGKFTNMLGALVVKDQNNEVFKIGGGNITTADREYIWKHRTNLINRAVTIAFTERSMLNIPLKAQLIYREEFLI